MSDMPLFYYKDHTLRILFLSSTLQYVSIKDIKAIPEILPFITNCVDGNWTVETQGEMWVENTVFAELLHAFHPEIQQTMLKQTIEVTMNALQFEKNEGIKTNLLQGLSALLEDNVEDEGDDGSEE